MNVGHLFYVMEVAKVKPNPAMGALVINGTTNSIYQDDVCRDPRRIFTPQAIKVGTKYPLRHKTTHIICK